MRRPSLYQVSVIAFFIVLPVSAALLQYSSLSSNAAFHQLLFSWLVFFAVGCRLLTAGFWQIYKPGFTAKGIFAIHDKQSYILVRELGLANLCIGFLGVLSLPFSQFLEAAAITGGLYFGLAGIQHVAQKCKTANEWFAATSDLFIAIALGILLIMRLV